ncbi:hypothetical protein [Mesobacillus subterraneus]|uniref:Uncharacterized protein n=1 Tax=Mesobacillus subterraneus TaxID=285983 RepID=A0A3R9ED23_9BACI|nr:hypothetical protein [Mesobacillus subterraneus]RSD27613.1 hypothetical protein EJA10_07465 [Mesobacillus subterraneus]
MKDFIKVIGLDCFMDLLEIEDKRPSTLLKLIPMEYELDKKMELLWRRSLHLSDFELHFPDSDLKQGKVLIPILKEPILKPIELKTKTEVYSMHGNFADYKIEYRRLHLVKIRYEVGFVVLRDDERYLKEIVKEEHSKEFFFIYDKKTNQWKTCDESLFKEERKKIEAIVRSDNVLNAFKKAFEHLQTPYLLEKSFEKLTSPINVEQHFKNLFHLPGILFILGDIPLEHMRVMEHCYYENLHKYKKRPSRHDVSAENSYAISWLKSFVENQGGYVYQKEFYPNLATLHSYHQLAKKYRSRETKENDRKNAIGYAKENNIKKEEFFLVKF